MLLVMASEVLTAIIKAAIVLLLTDEPMPTVYLSQNPLEQSESLCKDSLERFCDRAAPAAGSTRVQRRCLLQPRSRSKPSDATEPLRRFSCAVCVVEKSSLRRGHRPLQ